MSGMSTPQVSRLVLADHEIPDVFPLGHVEVRRITMGAGVAGGAHEHNGPVFGVIQSGSVHFQIENGPIVALRAGDTFYEPACTRINMFDATDDGVEFLAWFPLQAGASGVLTPPP